MCLLFEKDKVLYLCCHNETIFDTHNLNESSNKIFFSVHPFNYFWLFHTCSYL